MKKSFSPHFADPPPPPLFCEIAKMTGSPMLIKFDAEIVVAISVLTPHTPAELEKTPPF